MSVEALFTKQWNNTRYAAQPRFPLKSKNQGSAWGTDTTPDNFRLSSFYIPPIAKTTEAVPDCSENEGRLPSCQQQQKVLPVSEEQISALLKDWDAISESRRNYTKGTYSSNTPEELDTVFYTCYSPECIKCIREGERNPENPDEKIGEDVLQWEIKLDSKEQYDKIMKFLSGFPKEDNFRFATRQIFWNDFLDEKIDMNRFLDFYAWTNHGSPDMGKGENGEQIGINKERINDANAEYFNDQTMIGHVWTQEEMWAEWYAKIDCSNPGDCTQIALSGGESLAVRKDNIDELIPPPIEIPRLFLKTGYFLFAENPV